VSLSAAAAVVVVFVNEIGQPGPTRVPSCDWTVVIHAPQIVTAARAAL